MSQLVPANFGPLSTAFAAAPAADDLSAGIASSFGLIGYKGKVWSIRYRGEDTPLMRADGDGPRGSIEVVILKASTQISKIWYEQGYVEGSNAAPDCFSNNGVTPEPTAAKRQCESCALCPHNQWGSRTTPAGKQGKSCSDSKRIAVVPQEDMLNEAYGGPMLLRVPAASLQDLAHYGQKMQQMGYPYYAVSTRIGFDAAESYPKFTFGAIRPATEAEAQIILTHRDSHSVQRILSESEFTPATAPAAAANPASVFEQPPAAAVTQQVTQVQTPATTVTKPDVAPPVKAVETVLSDEERELAEFRAMKAQQKAQAEAAERAAAEAAAAAAAEAERAAAAAAAQAAAQTAASNDTSVELTDEEREMAEFRAMKAAQKAAAAKTETPKVEAPAVTEKPVATAASNAETVTPEVTAEAAKVADVPLNASSFENELDNLLSGLGV